MKHETPEEAAGHGAAAQRYETALCVALASLAYLFRDNHFLVYPEILYMLLAVLGFNLAAGFSLRRWPAVPSLSALFILGNCAAVAAIVAHSGEAQSNLWVLYLLPIYTVCLLLGRREVIWITLGTLAFNALPLILEPEGFEPAGLFALALKSGTLTLAAVLTWGVAQGDRSSRRDLSAKRFKLETAELALSRERERAGMSERMAEVGLMSSGVTHDLNNVFAVILGYLEILRKYRTLPPEAEPDLRSIQNASLMGRRIVAGFMNHARGRGKPSALCDLHDIIGSVLGLIENDLRRQRIRVELRLADGLPKILGDPVGLERLFLNLTTNALRAMPGGGVLTVASEALSGMSGAGPGLRVSVEDTGAGIAPDMLDKLFKPFATNREEAGGTGLGLYLSDAIARQHGGMLRADNNEKGGARFTLCLPALAAEIHA